MTREISDREYINLKVKKGHKPVVDDLGNQRDPFIVIVCECKKTYPRPQEVLQGKFDYFDHVVELLVESEFLDSDFLA